MHHLSVGLNCMMTLHSIELGIFLFVNSSWDLINDSHVVCLKFICGLKRDKKWGNPLFKLLKVVLLLWLKSEKVYWQCHFCFKLWPNTLWDLLSRPQYLIQWKTWSLIGMKILVTNQAGAKEGRRMKYGLYVRPGFSNGVLHSHLKTDCDRQNQ